MALQNPVAVYNAASPLEAAYVRDFLLSAGIEAFASETPAAADTTLLGMVPQVHEHSVWVDQRNIDQARKGVELCERRLAENSIDTSRNSFCYHCGEPVQRGVASCPSCGHPLDWTE